MAARATTQCGSSAAAAAAVGCSTGATDDNVQNLGWSGFGIVTFNGGDGDDFVVNLGGSGSSATFNGDDGCDSYANIGSNGTFNPGDQSTCLP